MRSDGQANNNTLIQRADVRQLLDAELSRRGLGHFEVYQCGPTLDEAEIITNYPDALDRGDGRMIFTNAVICCPCPSAA